MRKLLNTLYVTTEGAYLAREGECLLVRVEKETKLRLPIHTIGGIVCFGRVSCSPSLMGLCGERGILISFLSMHGRFLARVQGPVSGNVLLRREQDRRADDLSSAAEIARAITAAKVANARTVLLRATRDRPDAPEAQELERAARVLAGDLDELKNELPLEHVRGVEGDAAKTYFEVFDHLIATQKDDFFFHGRNRRPPLDNMNALLSFFYTLVMHDVISALESNGLDPQVGFLPRDRPGRPSLALDMMEELRPFLADRLALSLVNRRQLQGKDFTKTESGAIHLNDKARKEVLVAYQKRKQEEITHPFLKEKIALGLIMHVQAMLLARHLRGDLDGYPPFIWK